MFRPLVVQQDGGERANGVLVTSHHQVDKAYVVVRRHLAGGHARIHVLKHIVHNIRKNGVSYLPLCMSNIQQSKILSMA